jgi:hypothetical protein
MDLFLEPPWAFVNYVSHVSWTVKFIDELPEEERYPPTPPPPADDESNSNEYDSSEGAAT